MQAFLDMIAACEGTDDENGYQALFGYTPKNGRIFNNDYATHPNIKFPFRQTDGTTGYSTAAGRYQEIYPTFKRISAKLGTTDFSPPTQDKHAIELISEAGGLDAVENGNLQEAIDKCSPVWASLPASNYLQPKRSYEFATQAFIDAGGQVA